MTQKRKYQLLLLLTDLLAAAVVWVLFLSFRWMVNDGRVFGVTTILIPAFNFYRALLLYPVGCVLVHYLSGYYLRTRKLSYAHEAVTTLHSAGVIALGAFFIIVIDDVVDSYRSYIVSLCVLFALQFTVSLLPRMLTVAIQRRRHRRGTDGSNTLLIGQPADTEALKSRLPDRHIAGALLPEDIGNFGSIQQQWQIDDVIVATEHIDQWHLYQIIRTVYPYHTDISFTASVYDMLTGAAYIGNLKGTPLVIDTRPAMTDSALFIKRAFDVVTSAAVLIVFSPLLLLVSIAVKAGSPGPVIYSQERIGLFGRSFRIYKFRTMRADAEGDGPQLSRADDPRITPVGHWLRKYRLDELPQLWNVLRGDMSVVGPRPERAYYIRQIEEQAPYYCLLYKIRPGLTSWGPVRVGYTDTLEKMIMRLNYDIVYMENMSLGLDVKIMLYTLKVLAEGRGQ